MRSLICLAVILLISQLCLATTIHVPSEQPTIQAGINATVNGDTVLVAEGDFEGDGNRDIDFLGKSILVKSEYGPDFTVVNCEGSELEPHRGFIFQNSEDTTAILDGFQIRNGYSPDSDFGGGIYCNYSSPKIINCIIKYNSTGAIFSFSSSPIINTCIFYGNNRQHGGAIYLNGGNPEDESVSPYISNCTFYNNTAQAHGGVIYCQYNDLVLSINECIFYYNESSHGGAISFGNECSGLLSNCTFFANSAVFGSCIHIWDLTKVTIENSIIAYCENDEAIYCEGYDSIPNLICCDIYGNTGGDWVGCISGQAGINGNFSLDPMFCDTTNNDFRIEGNSPCMPQNNECLELIGALNKCGPRIWHVYADSSGDAPTIQAAVDSAGTGDTILVGDGVFNENITIHNKSFALISENGFQYTNILSVDDSIPIFDIYIGETEDTISISGFSLSGSNYSPALFAYVLGSFPFIIKNNLFENNQGLKYGGAINIASHCTLIIDSNQFLYNNAQYGSAICMGGQDLLTTYITNNIFKHNHADSSGIVYYNSDNNCFFINNILDSNSVNGGYLLWLHRVLCNIIEASDNQITHNILANAEGIVFIQGREYSIAKGNSIVENVILDQYGYSLEMPTPNKKIEAILNIIANNINSSGLYAQYNPGLQNFIVNCNDSWNNSEGNYAGFTPDSTNISIDPLFCNPDSGDYTIADASPCAPGNNSCNELIGAYGVGCSAIPSIANVVVGINEDQQHVLNHVPDIYWSFFSPLDLIQDQYEVAVGTDDDWTYAEMWNPAPFSGEDTSITYNGSPLLNGETYYLRARVNNSYAWSNWEEISFRMNSIPSIPTPISPEDSSFTVLMPILYLSNSVDPELDSLCYAFQIWADTELLITESPWVSEQQDSTFWQSDVELIENRQHWWRAKASDYYEESGWSDMVMFYANSINSSPTEFSLITPPENDTMPIGDLLPTFIWTKSSDPDPLDSIYYTLITALDSGFLYTNQVTGLVDSQYIATTELLTGEQYWWKVKAEDKYDGITWSLNVLTFWTMICGDANNDKDVNVSDAVYIINYVFVGGDPPQPLAAGDVNCDGTCNVSDAVSIINYVFVGGNNPCDTDGDGIPDC